MPNGVAHQNDLIAIQVGDEQQTDIEDPNGYTQGVVRRRACGQQFPQYAALYEFVFHRQPERITRTIIANANPDAISWDSYPFSNPAGQYISSTNWLALGNIFRRNALGSYIGATGNTPRPYGMYVQTYHDEFAVDPGEVGDSLAAVCGVDDGLLVRRCVHLHAAATTILAAIRAGPFIRRFKRRPGRGGI